MSHITSHKNEPETFKKLKYLQFGDNWPVVYILENGHEMYVGQTTSASSRLKQHYDNPDRRKLTNAHIILDEEYNLSATLDTESKLIQYIAADGDYQLQNSNSGLLNHNYYDRERYSAKFDLLWEKLQRIQITRNDLIQIRNSDLFKFSPYKALTEDQIDIVEKIYLAIKEDMYRTHIINGDPGTGKSVLAVYLAKYLKEHKDTKDFKVALVIPMSSLRQTLKKVFNKVKGLSSKMVVGPTEVVGQHFDLLIVDEAHRLRRRINLSSYGPYDKANKYYGLGDEGTQLDWILRASKRQVLFYDSKQSVVPGDVRGEDIERLPAARYQLTSQLRILAGQDYVDYIDKLLSLGADKAPGFGKYEFRYYDNLAEMVKTIKNKNNEYGLSRLLAGYAWTWQTKKDSSKDFDIELDGLKLKWNSTNIDWVNSPNAIDEVGCIHTVQGYDLNYVGVIIGPELGYDPIHKKLVVDKKKYMDFNGRRSIESEEELEKYIVNIYKTLLTRGIRGTYMHAVNKNLEKYLIERLGA